MNKDLIITIFVPTKQGTDGSTEGKIGTGYPVAEDLILTARHTVRPEQGNGEIQVRWHHLFDKYDPDNGWITLSVEDIVWEGEGKLDAALLRCPRPEKALGKGWGMIADKKPSVAKIWYSLGFSKATRYDNLREPDDISGTTESMADGADHFSLNVTSNPENPAMWKGTSGMPVFVGNEILGLVCRVPGNFSGKKLHAIPTWKMFEDEAFQKQLGLDKRQEYLTEIKDAIARILRDSGMEAKEDSRCPARLLADKLNLPWCGKKSCTPVAEELLKLHIEILFTVLGEIRRKMRIEDNAAGVSLCNTIVHYVLPVLFNPKVVEDLHLCKDDVTVALQTLPTELATVAEVIMAGVDRRAAKYRSKIPGQDWPEGEFSLPQQPEAGRDKDGEQLAKDLRSHLTDWIAPDVTDPFLEKKFDDYIRWRFIGDDIRPRVMSKEDNDIDQYIDNELKYQSEAPYEDERRTYYLLVPGAENNPAATNCIASLKKRYPHVVFLTFSRDNDLIEEQRRYRPLRDFIT
ncbi:MAG: hypothetical protein WGN25_01720 [Candidatus Electrothrix sp. GW3-4]|uniref:hypothetical protein n=1 Tax=Candidatus Electrothrix sp. GW3-4 TaxID=3126740 RepID=UPI0030D3C94C